MKKISTLISVITFVLLLIYSCDNKKGILPSAAPVLSATSKQCDTVTYSGQIKSIIDLNCATLGCHSGTFPQGGVDLTTYLNSKAQALNGRIKARAIDGIPSLPMPQTGLLPQSQRDLLQCWVDNGALQ